MPKISVIMATYGQEKYIVEAINSVLTQTFTDFELLIVPVCTDAATLAEINKFNDNRIKVLVSVFANLLIQRNHALVHALGEYYIFFDSDEVFLNNALAVLLDFVEKKKCVVASPDFISIDERGKKGKHAPRPDFSLQTLEKTCMMLDCSLCYRQAMLPFLPLRFEEGRRFLWNFWGRVGEAYPEQVLCTHNPVFYHREYRASMNNTHWRNSQWIVRIGDCGLCNELPLVDTPSRETVVVLVSSPEKYLEVKNRLGRRVVYVVCDDQKFEKETNVFCVPKNTDEVRLRAMLSEDPYWNEDLFY